MPRAREHGTTLSIVEIKTILGIPARTPGVGYSFVYVDGRCSLCVVMGGIIAWTRDGGHLVGVTPNVRREGVRGRMQLVSV